MKCFMHPQKEAIAACRNCGKGMCADCSSYSSHSGICPACKKEELIMERKQLVYSNSSLTTEKRWYIFKLIILFITIIYPFYAWYQIANINKQITSNSDRICFLDKEIRKIEDALMKGDRIL